MSDNLGLLPYRRRIVSVSKSQAVLSTWSQVAHITLVGRPIHVNRSTNPSMEEITRVQKLYIQELERSVIEITLRSTVHILNRFTMSESGISIRTNLQRPG